MRLVLTSPEHTKAAARALAHALQQENPGALLFYGDLGLGKTTFTAALAQELPGGSEAETSSPSFTICNIYCTEPVVHHFDLYRLPPGLPDESLEESLDDPSVLTIIEWSERLLPAGLPPDGIKLELRHGEIENERMAELSALGSVGRRCLQLMAAELAGPL